MKTLTLKRPWPYAIFFGGKAIENRTWAPPAALLGQRLAIHAGMGIDDRGSEALLAVGGFRGDLRELERGRQVKGFGMFDSGIVGVVTVVGVAASMAQARARGFDERWWSGPIGWLLGEARALSRPVPAMGRLGLWDLSPYQERQVEEQLRRVA